MLTPLLLFLIVCGQAILNGGAPAPAGDCNMVCVGNPNEFCGGPNRLNVYNYTANDLPSGPGGGGGGGGGGGSLPHDTTLPAPWTYGGCWVYVFPLTSTRSLSSWLIERTYDFLATTHSDASHLSERERALPRLSIPVSLCVRPVATPSPVSNMQVSHHHNFIPSREPY
jgi:hypothetical protein